MKTATKTARPSPVNGNVLPVGNHAGNTGGKKGRSGRKSKAFLTQCAANLRDSALWQAAREDQPLGVIRLSAEYTHGKPVEHTEVTGELTIRTIRTWTPK